MSLPPSEIPQGAIRFNTDSQRLEFYAQDQWWVMSTDTPNLGRSGDSTPGARGLKMGGFGGNSGGASLTSIEYFNIASTGNAAAFGDMSQASQQVEALGNSVRTLVTGDGSPSRNIHQITVASLGDSVDFGGDTSPAFTNLGQCNQGVANSTRGIFSGGGPQPASRINIMEYVTIMSGGDSVDFGNLTNNVGRAASFSSPVRGILGGGAPAANTSNTNVINFITIATTGHAEDFGDLTVARQGSGGGCSNATRGLFAGGFREPTSPTYSDVIDYVTIASTGNASAFGDLSEAKGFLSSASSPTRGVFVGGYTLSGGTGQPHHNGNNFIEYVEFATEGNTVDFGDLVTSVYIHCGTSNGHGGL